MNPNSNLNNGIVVGGRSKGEPFVAHQYYIDMRNKHIAHSVNPFEQAYAGVVLTPEDSGKKEVVGTSSFVMRHIVCDFNGVHQLGCLAKVVLGVVRDRAKKYEQELLEKSKKIPIDDLYKKERLQIKAPDPKKAGGARS